MRERKIKNDNKKKVKIAIIVLVAALILAVVGVTYAVFNFTGQGSIVNSISTGVMTMTYTEADNKISITNAMPMEDNVGKKLTGTDQVFDFTIETNITGKQSIAYEVTALKADTSTLDDKDVRLYLEKSTDGTSYNEVLAPSAYTSIDSTAPDDADQYGAKKKEMVLDTGTIQSSVKYYYRLRMWVSKDYEITKDVKTFTVTVNVYGKEGTYDASKEKPSVIKGSAVAKVEELSKTDTTNLVIDDTTGANIRYIGANPNNYVKFNNELWRIVGSFANISNGTTSSKRIKLVKNGYAYTGTAFDSNNSNDYSTSTLKTTLNGTYYNGLTTDAKNMIDNAVWNIGGFAPTFDASTGSNAANFYAAERSSTVYSGHATTWTGKIGLMYPSDYLYATSGSSSVSRTTCLSTSAFGENSNWYNSSGGGPCAQNDYLFDSSHWQWTITPYSGDSITVFYVHNLSAVGNLYANYTDGDIGVRPAVFLKSSVKITNGNGTESSPYEISL